MDGRVTYQPQEPRTKGHLSVEVRDIESGLLHTKEQVGPTSEDASSTSAHPLHPLSPNGGLSATSSLWRRHSVRAGVAQLGHGTGHLVSSAEDGMVEFWDRFTRKGKENIGVWDSLKAIVFSSCECSHSHRSAIYLTPTGLNVLLVFIPIAWVAHFLHWPHRTTFARVYMPLSLRTQRSLQYRSCFPCHHSVGMACRMGWRRDGSLPRKGLW